jgi:hypothetical protein
MYTRQEEISRVISRMCLIASQHSRSSHPWLPSAANRDYEPKQAAERTSCVGSLSGAIFPILLSACDFCAGFHLHLYCEADASAEGRTCHANLSLFCCAVFTPRHERSKAICDPYTHRCLVGDLVVGTRCVLLLRHALGDHVTSQRWHANSPVRWVATHSIEIICFVLSACWVTCWTPSFVTCGDDQRHRSLIKLQQSLNLSAAHAHRVQLADDVAHLLETNRFE